MNKGRSAKGKAAWQRGLVAETWAAWWLRLKGYRILETRYKTPVGEIDLVAKRGRLIAFVEVKARDTPGAAAQAITPKQQQRISRAAEIFLKDHPQTDARFDVVLIGRTGWPQHMENVWHGHTTGRGLQ